MDGAPPSPRFLQFLVWVLPCLALSGGMNQAEFVIYPEGLQEITTEYLDGFERALAGDDEAGLAWLYAMHGAEVDMIVTEAGGAMDVDDWTRLLGHDPHAMGTAWGAGEALMYAEAVAASRAPDQWAYEVDSVIRAHAWSSAFLTEGMHDAVFDNLVETEALQQVAIPAAYEAFSSVLDLLDIDPSIESVLVCGIDYLSEWESDFSLAGARLEPVRELDGEDDPDAYPRDVVGRQLVELLTRASEHDIEDVREAASGYYYRYSSSLNFYLMGVAST